ncbi:MULTISPECIES: hypothetical protein [Natrinema]|uniref:Uncharacterized protein n=1 Tax=Natrinema longum TaxID=370324 RepID=A0A8A2UA23_9EURY|nr:MULTISPECIES: hypothetical protein [Natrinema]MBZ6496579.1 hypothetical protein [Natrinema longum]QSW85520.1 hypothetical protein J0X27_01350 [Natrinema longum]
MNGDDDNSSELSIESPYFLFRLFESDVIAAEIDWEDEKFVFYPVNTLPDGHTGP